MDCYCDYEAPSVWRSSRPHARKLYRCEECSAAIHVGDEHEYVFGVWGGRADSVRTCARCVDLRQWVKNNIPCTCWSHGNLIDDLKASIEAACERAPDEMRGVRFGFLRRLLPIKRRAA